jgi:HK97 family phage prohead protease
MANPTMKEALDKGLDVIVQKQFSGTVKAFDEAKRTAQFVISTGSVDRDNDTINPAGWNLASFKTNPVVLWAHNSSLPPIGKAIEITTRGGGRNKKLVATAQFAKREQHELADTVFQLIVGGFLNATSVGFQPTEAEFNHERGGIDFLKQDLHEFSVVPVPANPDAVLTAAKSKGIDIRPIIKWAEYTLDHFQGEESEVLYKLVKAPVSQVDLSDLPEEVATVLEMVDLDLPGVKDALAHAVSEDAETITTFEGAGDSIEPLPQGDGDPGLEDAELEDAVVDEPEPEVETPEALEILESDPEDSSQGTGDQELLDMDPEDLKSAISAEVKLQVAAVSGKLPE